MLVCWTEFICICWIMISQMGNVTHPVYNLLHSVHVCDEILMYINFVMFPRLQQRCNGRIQVQTINSHGCFQVFKLFELCIMHVYNFLVPSNLRFSYKIGFIVFYLSHVSSIMCYFSLRWVKRDSYLPVGSQNLKATTKVST